MTNVKDGAEQTKDVECGRWGQANQGCVPRMLNVEEGGRTNQEGLMWKMGQGKPGNVEDGAKIKGSSVYFFL